MFRIESHTVVDRPPDQVWAFIADLDNLKRWDPDV
ncbi:MAG: SRPBCC family protein [Candidatus Limnocylindria bacterium]